MNISNDWDSVETKIKASGFSLVARFTEVQARDCLAKTNIKLAASEQLLLIGNAGPALWSHLSPEQMRREHPIDEYSVSTVSKILDDEFSGQHFRFLYPGDAMIPLQQLGVLAGWCQPSKLGVGISPEFGTWFAYRAAIVIGPFSETETMNSALLSDVCAACSDPPCMTACPVSAVKKDSFDLAACAEKRLSDKSECAKICAARAACPVGQGFRYGREQLEYHGSRSLTSLQKYYT